MTHFSLSVPDSSDCSGGEPGRRQREGCLAAPGCRPTGDGGGEEINTGGCSWGRVSREVSRIAVLAQSSNGGTVRSQIKQPRSGVTPAVSPAKAICLQTGQGNPAAAWPWHRTWGGNRG